MWFLFLITVKKKPFEKGQVKGYQMGKSVMLFHVKIIIYRAETDQASYDENSAES